MRKRYSVRVLYVVAAISLALMVVYLLLLRNSLTPSRGSRAEKSAMTVLSDVEYGGSGSCRACHSQEYDDWEDSFHALAMAKADTRSVKGDFDTSFTSQGVTSRFFTKGGKYYVNTEGPDGRYHDYEVAYTFGAAPLQQYLVKFPGGRMQCLRTAWDTRENKWFDLYPAERIDPGEWLHWSRGGLNWNTMCADCHSTNVRKNFNEDKETFNTRFSLINVSCEACHGPGREHVQERSAGRPDRSGYGRGMSALPGSESQVDQCGRCHSRRGQFSAAYDHSGEFMDHYVPEVLRDDLYYPDGQIREEVYEYGSFLQSKMYRKKVKCSDCHNPHGLKLRAQGNNLCGQCHAPQVYNTRKHHFHGEDTEGAQCVNCHMPGRVYMGNDFRRDHSLRVPRPDLSVKYNTPNACNQCHTDKSDAWAAAAVENWYGPDRKPHFSEVLALGSTRSGDAVSPLISLAGDTSQPAIARATAVWYLGQMISEETVQAIVKSLESPDHLIRYTAVNALTDMPEETRVRHIAPLLNDKVRTVRYAAANVLADISVNRIKGNLQQQFQTNIHEYEASLAFRADFPGGQMEKGIFYQRRGQIELAEQAYAKAIEIDNHLNAARLNLAHLYNRQGKNQKAIALFKEIVDQEPGFGIAYYSLGLLYAEEQDMKGAILYLAKAAELERNPRVYYNLGIAYQQTQQAAKAEESYLKGLEVDAGNTDVLYALSILYVQQQQFAKAKPYVQKLNELHPENAQIRELARIVIRGMR